MYKELCIDKNQAEDRIGRRKKIATYIKACKEAHKKNLTEEYLKFNDRPKEERQALIDAVAKTKLGKERVAEKEWIKTHPKEIAVFVRDWAKKCPKKAIAAEKRWAKINPGIVRDASMEWIKTHPLIIADETRAQIKLNAKKKEAARKSAYRQTPNGKMTTKRSQAKRKRELGYNLLFPVELGEVGHHVTDYDVIGIPEDVHEQLSGYIREKHRALILKWLKINDKKKYEKALSVF